MTAAPDASALAALDANFLDASRAFVVGGGPGEYVERRDVAIVSCGLPAEGQNFGFLKPPHRDLPGTAAAVAAYFGARKLAPQLVYRDASDAPAHALAAHGWRPRERKTPGMTLALPAQTPPPPAGLRIEEARTSEGLARFRETAFRGFGFPPAAAHLFLGEHLLTLPNVRLYAGVADGEVVATSLLFTTGEVAGIYWVATLDRARGRGCGAALTGAAAQGGAEAGCRIASLQASAMGAPVYARMGFAHVLDYVHLLPPEEKT